MMKNILITGATGFLGSELLGLLKSREYNLYCPIRKGSKPEIHSENIIYYKTDLTNSEVFIKDTKRHVNKCDFIIHLASNISCSFPKECFQANLQFTETVIKSADTFDDAKLFFISSSSASLSKLSSYGKSKYLSEKRIQNECKEWVILRFPILFGGGDKNVNEIIRLCKSKKIVPIFGNGKYRVQPLYVTDAAKAITLILQEYRDYSNEIIDLMGLKTYRFIDLVRLIAANIPHKVYLIKIPALVWFPPMKILGLLSSKIIQLAERIMDLVQDKYFSNDVTKKLLRDEFLDFEKYIAEKLRDA